MPETTVQKMIGAIAILISLTKALPRKSIHSLVAIEGASQPRSYGERDGDQHLDVKDAVPRLTVLHGLPPFFALLALRTLRKRVIARRGGRRKPRWVEGRLKTRRVGRSATSNDGTATPA